MDKSHVVQQLNGIQALDGDPRIRLFAEPFFLQVKLEKSGNQSRNAGKKTYAEIPEVFAESRNDHVMVFLACNAVKKLREVWLQTTAMNTFQDLSLKLPVVIQFVKKE